MLTTHPGSRELKTAAELDRLVRDAAATNPDCEGLVFISEPVPARPEVEGVTWTYESIDCSASPDPERCFHALDEVLVDLQQRYDLVTVVN